MRVSNSIEYMNGVTCQVHNASGCMHDSDGSVRHLFLVMCRCTFSF